MDQGHLESRPSVVYGADEVDLFELFKMLWQEKLIIIVSTLVFAFAAFLYNPPGEVEYNTVITLRPAPLSLYSDFVAKIENGEQQSITLARYTSEQVLVLLMQYLTENKTQYFKDKNIISFRANPKNTHEITLQLTTPKDDNAIEYLQGYLADVSEYAVKEINELLLGVNISGVVTSEMLYASDEPTINEVSLTESKKKFIISLAIVLGGMLGVLIALIRSVLRKRKERVIYEQHARKR